MRLSIKQIIFIAVSNYISQDQIDEIRNKIGQSLYWPTGRFMRLLSGYFDFEKLRTEPYIKGDILIYNYLMYDCLTDKMFTFLIKELPERKLKFKRTKLINKYEREVLIPQLRILNEARKILDNLSK